jgi:acyl-[acyl carrier protein]--UDP-N-acetylglucosamine O-acyltransferase
MTRLEATMRPRRLSEIAGRYGLELRGPDREIVTLGPLDSRSAHGDRLLTFVTSRPWLERFAASGIAAAVVPEALAPDEGSVLVTTGDPETAFYGLLADTAEAGDWSTLEPRVGDGTVIAATATVDLACAIGRDCRIMAGAVLLANTRLGDGVVVKPNATLGGDGFQVRTIAGRRRVVPHTGGVDVRDGATVGSSTCVDRGLFGDFTTIGEHSHVDNLVHVAHSVEIGASATIVACAELSGSVQIGEGVWVGPRAAINASVRLGAHSFVGTGAVVVRDLPAHALAYGSPARIQGWLCFDGTRLEMVGDAGACSRCGQRFRLDGDDLREA